MKKHKADCKNCLLEEIRKKGRNGDTILAHINPLEAMMLKGMGGSGTINPKTGLHEFGFFNKPLKATKAFVTKPKRAIAEIVGIGSALFGGPVGGAIGGATKELILGRPNRMLGSAISGGIQGAVLPGVGKLAGQGLSSMGATTMGDALQNYGTSNMGSWMGNMGQMGKGVSGLFETTGKVGEYGSNALLSKMYGANENGSALENYNRDHISGISAGDDSEEDPTFMDKLTKNSKNYLTKPKNLLSLGSLAMSIYDKNNKPKELTAAQRGKAAKEEMLAARLTPSEMAEQEQYELAMEQARRKNARKKFLPEERIDIEPLYNKVSTPQEYAQTGRWMNYYDNPRFTGQPIRF